MRPQSVDEQPFVAALASEQSRERFAHRVCLLRFDARATLLFGSAQPWRAPLSASARRVPGGWVEPPSVVHMSTGLVERGPY
jgi:hypothetical protein